MTKPVYSPKALDLARKMLAAQLTMWDISLLLEKELDCEIDTGLIDEWAAGCSDTTAAMNASDEDMTNLITSLKCGE